MTTNTNEKKPLVTFALFAYQQEAYIREAIEGAFAQTYEPLEIILSDDCSTDRTFEIMQEMAEAYEGPHQILVKQANKNLGLIIHVNSVLSIARGEFFVLAAGDDISEANRVEKSVRAFHASDDTLLVHSSVTDIDASSFKLGQSRPPNERKEPEIVHIATSASIYIGATGTISMDLYRKFGPIEFLHTYEDLIFGFRACLLDSTKFIEEPLVRYRRINGLSSESKRSDLSRWEKRTRRIRLLIDTFEQRLLDLEKITHEEEESIRSALKCELVLLQARREFYNGWMSFLTNLIFMNRRAYCHAFFTELKFSIGAID